MTFYLAWHKTLTFDFCISTVPKAQREKRYDQELVLRFFAFKNCSDKYSHEVGDFLTEYMEAASDPDGVPPDIFDAEQDVAAFEKTFRVLRKAAESLNDQLGSRIFGSVDSKGVIRGQFAVYHFEGLALGIQSILPKLDPDNAAQMKTLGEKILSMKSEPDLRNFTGGGKNTAQAFRERRGFFQNKFEAAF